MEYMTTSEAAEKWKITRRRVNALCDEGRIEGAEKKGRFWLIPMSVNKPKDGRVERWLKRY